MYMYMYIYIYIFVFWLKAATSAATSVSRPPVSRPAKFPKPFFLKCKSLCRAAHSSCS